MSKHNRGYGAQQMAPGPQQPQGSPSASVIQASITAAARQPQLAAAESTSPIEYDEPFDKEEVWSRFSLLIELKEGETDQARTWKLKIGAYVFDRVGVLPRGAIARLVGYEPSWVNCALKEVGERMDSNWTFSQYVNRLVRVMKTGGPDDGSS